MKIKELAALYIADKRQHRRANTVEGYESALKCHVLPRWGELSIEDIDPEDIQDWIDDFDKPGAAHKAYKTLRQVIRWSIKSFRLKVFDPTTYGFDLPSIPECVREAMETRDISRFLRGIWGADFEAAVLCSVSLGLRPGEACGLMWSDIDLRTGKVEVRRSRQDVRGGVMDFDVKTALSRRTLFLPDFARKRLKTIGKGKTGYLIGEARPSAIKRKLKSFCRKNGLPWVSMKNLRHTYSTALWEAGIELSTISMLLGHSTEDMLQKHYLVMRKSICDPIQQSFEKLIIRAGA